MGGSRITNGPADVLPGIGIVPTGGHSVGLQFVTVNTKRGKVVLASDVTHFYENMETYLPSPPRSTSATAGRVRYVARPCTNAGSISFRATIP